MPILYGDRLVGLLEEQPEIWDLAPWLKLDVKPPA